MQLQAHSRSLELTAGEGLDREQRYRLSQALRFDTGHASVKTAQVVDTRSEAVGAEADVPGGEMTLVTDISPALGAELLPVYALPYRWLRDQFASSIPELRDAWLEKDYAVVIIEDRSHLPDLLSVWQQGELDPLQQIHCFYIMAELWDAVGRFESRSSLLNLNNLCVDEDQIVCLRQLEIGMVGGEHTLADMGLLWQSLLQANPTSLSALGELAAKVTGGHLSSTDDLKEALVTIADDYQSQAETAIGPTAETLTTASQLTPADLPGVSRGAAEEPGPDSLDSPTMVLPMKLTGLEDAGQSHVGRQRDQNEDSYYIQSHIRRQETASSQSLDAKCAYILCDGMGGHSGGEVASQLAVESLRNYLSDRWESELPEEAEVRAAINQANQAIYEKNQAEERTGSARMGTTLVMLLLKDTYAVVAHVGDSRLYRYTKRQGLQQITVDHEVGQREIRRGVDPATAYARPDAYQLTQALGPCDRDMLDPSFSYLSLTEDTLLLLCSDGLSDDGLLENHCATHIEPILRGYKDIDDGVSDLIELANEKNGHDNITALMVKLKVKPDLSRLQGS